MIIIYHLRNRVGRRRRGAVTVEMAMTLPILFLLFFAAFEFCRANMLRHTAENAAYEGARRGIVPGATTSDMREAALGVLRPVGARDVLVETQPAYVTPETAAVTVTVQIPMNTNGYVGSILFRNRVIEGNCKLTRESLE